MNGKQPKKEDVKKGTLKILDISCFMQDLSDAKTSLIVGGQAVLGSKTGEPSTGTSSGIKWGNWIYTYQMGWVCQPGKVC
ncbi:hypothetical protein [Nostoc sp. ChiQUE01b]|uniref:hypothetical protein n=1 Tax=Nostoc sp. ChiQUE01b TaxID=3075376 RepID=UPI002AD1FB53|nr:hypothetical protein [Nostoc sp. ChiQUE01b]MDZ8263812.1 hypothetical protein [Nostoc sp. ChiQUE01b]